MAANAGFIKDINTIRTFTFTAGANLLTGEMALVEDTYGMAYGTILNTYEGSLVYYGEKLEVPKATGTGKTFAAGDILWLDPATKTVHKDTATGYIYVGTAIAAATAAATHVLADFDGRKRA